MLCLGILLHLCAGHAYAQGWQFIGPDSTAWREILDLDATFRQGGPTRVAVATRQGVTVNFGDRWRYVLPNRYTYPPPAYWFHEAVRFSPWNDSVAFVASSLNYAGEPAAGFFTVFDVYARPVWGQAYQPSGPACWYSLLKTFAIPPHDTGKVYGWVCSLLRSSNNGAMWSWELGQNVYSNYFLKANLARDSTVYVGGTLTAQDSVGIHVTTNEGATWTLIYRFPDSFARADLIAWNDRLVLSTSKWNAPPDTFCGIFKSANHGGLWVQVLSGVNVEALTQDAQNPSLLYAAARTGIFRSLDGGTVWEMHNNMLPSLNLVRIAKDPHSDTVYVATSLSGVYKVFDYAVNVVERPALPHEFLLSQNYPNPFNPTAIVNYQLAIDNWVSIKVYDVLGREVATLVDGKMGAGSHEVTFDGSNLPSGVYVYRLVSGTFHESKRMILMK
jgi:hypothetical protein